MTTAGATYSPTAAATLIPAMATPALGMQHVATLPGSAATRLAQLTNLDDITPVTAAVGQLLLLH